MKFVNKILLSISTLLTLGSGLTTAHAATTHTYSNQDVTAYVTGLGKPNAWGKTPTFGTCAVHPSLPGGSGTSPIIPFGTNLNFTQPLNCAGADTGGASSTRSSFQVQDTGDIGWTLWSQYFADIWFGINTSQYIDAANQFGVKKATYTCVY